MPSITELPYPTLVLILLGPTISNAQDCEPDVGCSFQISAETNVHQIGTHTIFWPVSTLVTTTKTGRFLVLAGETYEWSTRIEDGGEGSPTNMSAALPAAGSEADEHVRRARGRG